MQATLEMSFANYVDLLKMELKCQEGRPEQTKRSRPLILFANPAWEIQKRVQKVLNSQEFGSLIEATKPLLNLNKGLREYLRYDHDFNADSSIENHDLWFECAVHNFFCRSGCYINCFNGEVFEVRSLFEQYCESFKKKGVRTVYLAPMGGVEFSRSELDFGDFKIRTFSEEELEKIFSNKFNKIFYPKSYFDNADSLDRWFIYLEDVELWEEIVQRIDEDIWYGGNKEGIVKFEYSNFPRKVESALNVLVLFDWGRVREDMGRNLIESAKEASGIVEKMPINEAKSLRKGVVNNLGYSLQKFKMPFVLRANDNLIGFPEQQYEPLQPLENAASPFHLSLDQDLTEMFDSFIRKTKNSIDNLRLDSSGPRYLRNALGHMVKGFFSSGLDEFISYVIALEALVGEKKELREKLRTRISNVLGDTEGKRRQIRDEISELYNFLCSVVHGEEFARPLYVGHLVKMRTYARKLVLWYLNCTNYFTNKIENKDPLSGLPSRSDILNMIDFGRNRIPSEKGYINIVPKGFPHVKEWLG